MCTLAIRHETYSDYPLILITNRDEFHARPAVLPSVIVKRPAIFAPKDLEAGGTWFGINQWRLVVAITNIYDKSAGARNQKTTGVTRSRGLLTLDALHCKDFYEVKNLIRQRINQDNYRFFNLVVGSITGVMVFTYTGELKEFTLSNMTTTILNSPYVPKSVPSYDLTGYLGSDQNKRKWFHRATRFLSQHPDVCKHYGIFGTRSSQIVILGRQSGERAITKDTPQFWYSDGPPCKTEYVDFSSELQSIFENIYSSSPEA